MTPDKYKQLKKDYMDLFNSPLGKKILLDIENHCYKRDTTDNDLLSPNRVNVIILNEGKRQVLLHIETMMSPEGMETQGASNTEGGK